MISWNQNSMAKDCKQTSERNKRVTLVIFHNKSKKIVQTYQPRSNSIIIDKEC